MWYQLNEKTSDVLQELMQLKIKEGNTLTDLTKILWHAETLKNCVLYVDTKTYYQINSNKDKILEPKQNYPIYEGHLNITSKGELYLLWCEDFPRAFDKKDFKLHLFLAPQLIHYLETKEIGYQLESRESILTYAAISYAEVEVQLLHCLEIYDESEEADEQLNRLLTQLDVIKTDYHKKITNYLAKVNVDILDINQPVNEERKSTKQRNTI